MSDPPETVCPSCREPRLERLISASAFTLKGSGWYADGYGAKPDTGTVEKKASKEPDAAAPAADSPKTETAAPKSEPAAAPAPAPSPKKD